MSTLRTERLLLREFQTTDVAALAVILRDPQVMRFSVRGVLSEQATGQFVENCIEHYACNGFGVMAVVNASSGQLAGFCGLHVEPVDGVPEIEVGYRLAPEFWGRGLASEAVNATLHHGFELLHLASIIAIVQPENRASVNVLHKVGFEGYVHSQYHRLGVRIYRMTPEQWRARHC